jgi:hypothetical protein
LKTEPVRRNEWEEGIGKGTISEKEWVKELREDHKEEKEKERERIPGR